LYCNTTTNIVVYFSADGNYEVSFYSNVVIEYTGQMLWVPPAIYKSSCTIDVEFFPFDGSFSSSFTRYDYYLLCTAEQTCAMIFGSWTFSKDEVTIAYLDSKRHVELNDYSFSGIWDIMEVPGELIHSKSKISYQIKIRRYGTLTIRKIQYGDTGVHFKDSERLEWISTESCTSLAVQLQTGISDPGYVVLH
jgi:hypothetical protein